jgi:hypothetical protein
LSQVAQSTLIHAANHDCRLAGKQTTTAPGETVLSRVPSNSAFFTRLSIACSSPLSAASSENAHSAPAKTRDGGVHLAKDTGALADAGAEAIEALRQAYRAGANAYSIPPVDWRPCPIVTDGTGTDALCANFTVPLPWPNRTPKRSMCSSAA